MITTDIENLKTYLSYNPNTGVFNWKVQKSNFVKVGMIAGTKSKSGHIKITLDRKIYAAHRLAWAFETGSWPEMQIDHINGDPTDNRIQNLRDVSKGDNMRNFPRLSSNTSGRVGVCFSVEYSKWCARIAYKGKRIFLGRYTSFEEACRVRDEAEITYGYHENHGRDRRDDINPRPIKKEVGE